MLRAAILSQDSLLRDSLAGLLELKSSAEIVATASEPRQAVEASKEHFADILIVESAGISASDLQYLLGAVTMSGMQVIFLGTPEHSTDGKGHVIDRGATAAELVEKIRELQVLIKPGRNLVREGRKTYGSDEDGMLSRREYEVAQLVARGMSNRRISQTTGLREQSVKNLVSVVMKKLDCENRVQVALKLVNAPVAAH